MLRPPQQKYCTTRKELLAIVKFTRQVRHYLLGQHFIIRTNPNSLIWQEDRRTTCKMDRRASPVQYGHTTKTSKNPFQCDGLSRITDTLPSCPGYLPTIELDQLPCRWCNLCTRARQQWGVFEEEVDGVLPIYIRRGLADTEPYNWIDSGRTEINLSQAWWN